MDCSDGYRILRNDFTTQPLLVSSEPGEIKESGEPEETDNVTVRLEGMSASPEPVIFLKI